MRDTIQFMHGERECALTGVAPGTTVLQWLRATGRVGTKEGCAEGDCGACTVALGEAQGSRVHYRAVNACILFIGALDERQLLTVEHLATSDGTLHPAQRALVDLHGSQCGFCTPGFVMSLFARQHEGGIGRNDACEALAGNLCRCTGYRPILDAAAACEGVTDRFGGETTAARLAALPGSSLTLERDGQRYAAPRSLAAAVALRADRPEAVLLAGGTDVALWITKERRLLADVIALDRVAELARIDVSDMIRIGAGVAYEDALPVLEAEWPSLGAMLRRLGSRQIRHRGTIGGNLGTASPIGDMAPALIALDASVVLTDVDGERAVPVEGFFTGYRKTVMTGREIVARIDIPRAAPAETLRVFKVSKRREEDISSVCAAFRLRLEGGRVAALRAGYGGVAATPVRVAALEQAVIGRPWNEATVASGMAALDVSIAPIDDMRASARYRRVVAGNLLRRLWLETTMPAEAAA